MTEKDNFLCKLCGEPMPAGEEMFYFHGYSSPCPAPQKNTLQAYFERAEIDGVIDFNLRITRTPEGKLDFYIHPSNKNGETGDFTVSGTRVEKIKNNLGAGSSRP